MRVQILADFNISESIVQEAKNDLISFFEKHLKIYNLENNCSMSLLKVEEESDLSLNNCNFPNILIDLLNKNNIYSLTDLSNLTYREIRRLLFNKSFKLDLEPDNVSYLRKKLLHYGFSFKEDNTENFTPLIKCDIPVRIHNALMRSGIKYIQDLSFFTNKEIATIRGIGVVQQIKLEKIMKKYGVWYAEDRM